MREGGALGVLFQARNALLGVDLNGQRAATLAEEKRDGATLTTVGAVITYLKGKGFSA